MTPPSADRSASGGGNYHTYLSLIQRKNFGKEHRDAKREYAKKALFKIGDRLLERKEYRRAKGTFQAYFSLVGKPRGDAASMGLARALVGTGNLMTAAPLLRLCIEAGTLDEGGKKLAEDLLDITTTLADSNSYYFHL